MTEERNHRLFLIFVIFCLFVTVGLLLLQPVFMVLWVLALVLGLIIFSQCKPHVWQPEMQRIRNRMNRVKGSMFSAPGSRDDNHVTSFTPDHVLISTRAGSGECYAVNMENYLIGRGQHCNCCLRNVKTVSKEHCRIIFRKYSQEYYVEDLRSSNGTYLGTRRLEPFTQEKLLEGSELTVGDCCFRFVKRTGSAQ